MGKQKVFPTLVITMLVISIFTSIFFVGPISIRVSANPGDQSESWYNETTLNVTVKHKEPRINWYDLQNATGVSMLNKQLDVDQNYYFKVNISSDQGWADIEYIWITAWADLGTDPGSYNGTAGGNINLNITYDNSSETASARLVWPTNGSEATFIGWSEVNVTGSDPYGIPGETETYNLTFIWKPSYQFRYAPDPTNDTAGFNDLWSWNFNITVLDDDGYYSYNNPTVGETINEFGVYSYTEIVSAGWPTIVGAPGDNVSVNDPGGGGNITLVTRSNGNYSLSVDVDNLTHTIISGEKIIRNNVWVRGGDKDVFENFTTPSSVVYLYGSAVAYHAAEDNDYELSTDDVEYKCFIPLGTKSGKYTGIIHYYLKTQTA
ncbi:MAG: hypothetical protein QHH19_07085 [Candidatus Thermoplasmatota archaeon]|jgi:hypothetical protein|nr:hypothetical protein [Candidatus Thermoplasmatota archaeon]